MILNNFILGVGFCLYLCFFVIAYMNRSDKAPFREAFAWLGLVSALQCLWEFMGHLFQMETQSQIRINVFVDSLGLPFFFLVIECICKQDMIALPWKTRWGQVALSEIPMLVVFAISLLTDGYSYLAILYIWIAVYLLIFVVRMGRNLREYNRLQSYARDGQIPSKNWTMWILGIGVAIIALYILLYPYFDNTMIENVYLSCNILLNIVIAYFVWRQRPENIKELAMIKTILQEERNIIRNKMEELSEKESQIDALSTEMSENAEKLKRKASIKEYMDTVRLQHPQFERTLNKLADGRLTNHDILLCMLIHDGRKVSYIAKMTGVNVKSVEMGRSRLRKKLNLSPEDNLNDFIKRIGTENSNQQ